MTRGSWQLPGIAETVQALGGYEAIGSAVSGVAELDAQIRAGLPRLTLDHLADRLFSDPAQRRAFKHRLVPEATLRRRQDRLSPAESEKVERIARIMALADRVWGDVGAARRFLLRPHPLLDGMTGLEAAETDLGARRVETILNNIWHGLPV